MRLTCPNCGAQYEVPDAVIPASGRDVQCSNCGNTWFQDHRDQATTEAEQDAPRDDPETEIAEEPEIEAGTEPAAVPEGREPAPRRLDPELADILREEAERERAARAAEAGGRLETQPDLGLDGAGPDADERGRQARMRMERLRGGTAAEETPEAESGPVDIDPPSRRNLLPDIDEINSSLNSERDRGASQPNPVLPEEALPGRGAGGFRIGVRLAVITSVLALAVYLMAPRIAVLVPSAEGALAQYVAAVDALRAQLSEAVRGLIAGG